MSLDSLLSDHVVFHSGLQIDRFILGRAAVTPYAAYKQALRELHTRIEALKLEAVDLEEQRRKLDDEDELVRRRAGLRIDSIERTMTDRIREICHFHAHASALKEEVGELTPERRAQLEEEAWTAELRRQAAFDLVRMGTVGPETLEAIYLLPKRCRVSLVAELETSGGREALVSWFHAWEPVLPDVTGHQIGADDVRRIACLT